MMMDRFNKVNNVNNNNYIFSRVMDIKLNEDYASKQFKKAVRDSGLNDNIHFHTLRHSFASRLIQKGASVFVVKELLGHEDIKTTQIYSHLKTENLAEAVNLL
jgi:integrase/recombinase XerD